MKCPTSTKKRKDTLTKHTQVYIHTQLLLYDLLAALLTGTDEKPHQTQRKLCFERTDLFQDLLKLGIWQKKKKRDILKHSPSLTFSALFPNMQT